MGKEADGICRALALVVHLINPPEPRVYFRGGTRRALCGFKRYWTGRTTETYPNQPNTHWDWSDIDPDVIKPVNGFIYCRACLEKQDVKRS